MEKQPKKTTVVQGDVLEFELSAPMTLDNKEYNKIYIRKPKAKERYTAIANAGTNAPVQITIMETILLCATIKNESNGFDVNVTREAYGTISWKDASAIEAAFFDFIGGVI